MQQRKSDVVKSYLRQHTDTPSRTIARYLCSRYPSLFEDFNATLNMVRYYRRAAGEQLRRNRQGKEEFAVKIPAAAKRRHKKIKLSDAGRWMVCGDLHVPYHEPRAVELAFRHAIDKGCEHLLVNGDALDAYQQSAWVKDPQRRNVDAELQVLKELLSEVAAGFSGHKVYKIGNHEARIENYLFENAPKMIGMSKWDLREVLRKELELEGWTVIGSKQLYSLGKLNGYHGHELPRGLTNPVSVGRGVWLRTKQNGFTNHWHSTSTHIETNGNKTKTWVCFSVGCLCDLHPDYAPINGWNHGFAMVDIDSRGNFSETNHRIVDGEIW